MGVLGSFFHRTAPGAAVSRPKVRSAPSTILQPFTARDGENLALYEWPLDEWDRERGLKVREPRAVVLIVHGLGEHASRYAHVARRLLEWGFAVRAYDQRGHGQSGGARGALPNDSALLDDLAELVDDTRRLSQKLRRHSSVAGHPSSLPRPLPLIVLGHSLGGLVASRFVSLKMRPVEGLILSSPALDLTLNAWQKLALAFLPRLTPHLCFDNGLDPFDLTHDDLVVQNYLADRLVHRKISMRLGRFMAMAGPATVAAADRWSTPTLLMYAGTDRLVNPNGSQTFAERAAASPDVPLERVSSQCFEGHYHEIFNEVDTQPVFDTLKTWLLTRF